MLLHADVVVAWCCCNVLSRVLFGYGLLLWCVVCRGGLLIVCCDICIVVCCSLSCFVACCFLCVLLLSCVVCLFGRFVVVADYVFLLYIVFFLGVAVVCLMSLLLWFVMVCRCCCLLWCVEVCW